MPSRRILRINHLLRAEIAELLRREIKDGALSTPLISITEVDTSPDLKTAKVYFSVYGDEEEMRETQKHLERAAGFLRRSMMGRLDLRYTPQLVFLPDRSMADADRIMRLMRDIEAERPRPETPSDSDT